MCTKYYSHSNTTAGHDCIVAPPPKHTLTVKKVDHFKIMFVILAHIFEAQKNYSDNLFFVCVSEVLQFYSNFLAVVNEEL